MTDKDIETLLEISRDTAEEYGNQILRRKVTTNQQILCALWTANLLLADIALSLRVREGD